MRVVFVHGACVRDGAWWWHPTGDLLAAAGVSSDSPLLPSCGESAAPVDGVGPGLAADVAAVPFGPSRLLQANADGTVGPTAIIPLSGPK